MLPPAASSSRRCARARCTGEPDRPTVPAMAGPTLTSTDSITRELHRAASALRRTLQRSARRLSRRRNPRRAPYPAVPGLHDPCRRRPEVGRRRTRVRRLRDGDTVRCCSATATRRVTDAATAQLPHGTQLGANTEQEIAWARAVRCADAFGRAHPLPQLRHRGVDDGDPHRPRLHGPRAHRHLRRPLPRLARLRRRRLRAATRRPASRTRPAPRSPCCRRPIRTRSTRRLRRATSPP